MTDLLTVTEAAKRFRRTRRTLETWIRDGLPVYRRPGSNVRHLRVDELIEELKRRNTANPSTTFKSDRAESSRGEAATARAYEKLLAAIEKSTPECRDLDLFIADEITVADQQVLAPICAVCPIFAECARYAQVARPSGGYWAGQLHSKYVTRASPQRVDATDRHDQIM